MKNNLLILTIIATLAPSANLLFAMGNPKFSAAYNSAIENAPWSKTATALQATAAQSQSLGMDKIVKDQVDAKKKEADRRLALEKVMQAIKADDLTGVQQYIDEGGDINAFDIVGFTPLSKTVYESASLATARLLLQNGANPNLFTGISPLHDAIEKENFKMGGLLVEYGADVEAETHTCMSVTPVLALLETLSDNYKPKSMHDCSGLIKVLISHGADLERNSNAYGFDAHYFLDIRAQKAIRNGQEAELEAIRDLQKYIREYTQDFNSQAIALCLTHLHKDPNAKTKADLDNAMTAFIKGPQSNEDKAQSELRKAIYQDKLWTWHSSQYKNMNLEHRDETGHTPLLLAVYLGHRSSAASLLIVGASLGAKNKYGQTAYMIADQQLKAAADEATGNEEFKEIKKCLEWYRIEREKAEQEKIKTDEERAKKETADMLLQFGQLKRAIADGDDNALSQCSKLMLDKNGPALLLYAAKLGRAAIVEKLLKNGVQANSRDDDYHTALTVSAINGNVETVAVLLKHMTPEHIKMTLHGKTAYELAQEAAAKPGYEQRLEKYKQIMAMLDPYNNAAATSKK